jgi:hypothetical protein
VVFIRTLQATHKDEECCAFAANGGVLERAQRVGVADINNLEHRQRDFCISIRHLCG